MIKVDRRALSNPASEAERLAFTTGVRPSAPAGGGAQGPAEHRPAPGPAIPEVGDTSPSAQDDFIGERRAPPAADPAPGPAAPIEPPRLPWADAHPRVKTNFQLRMPEELSFKLTYLSTYMVPHKSMHDIALDLVTKGVDELLKLVPQTYPMPPTRRDKRDK